MITDHIKYLKNIIEEELQGRENEGSPFLGRLFEVPPSPSLIAESIPCASISHRPASLKKDGSWNDSRISGIEIIKTRRLYTSEHAYQVDFYSRDIYDFLEKDSSYTSYLRQLVQLVADKDSFPGEDGQNIDAACGAYGIIDDPLILVDGIYKAFCQVKFLDGVYKSETVPVITGANISDGGIKNV